MPTTWSSLPGWSTWATIRSASVDPNPRFLAEKLVDPSALVMGQTAENLHDRFPHLTKERADAFAAASQAKLAKAYADGKVQPDLVPVATRSAERGWGLATADEPPRPGTTVEDLAELKTPFRPHGARSLPATRRV